MLRNRVLTAVALVLLMSPVARAETFDPTTVTAAALLQRADLARGSLEAGSYTRVRQVHVGGVDRTSTTWSEGDNWLWREQGGGFTVADGSYKGQSWSQDENGIVVLHSDFRSKVDPNVLAWEHPDDPTYRVQVLGVTQAAPQEYVVEANPPGGSDEYRYYDAKTHLLARVVAFEKDRYRHVTDYLDYRLIFGEETAFTLHSYDGRPQNDRLTRTVSFEKTSASVSLTIPPSRALFALSGNGPIELPVRFTPQGIVIRANVNGRGLDFLLDSGASGLIIDPGVAHQLGLTPFGRESTTIGGGDVDIGLVRIAQMTLGPLQLRDVVYSTSPYDQQFDGARVVGLMGYDLLASAITEIDFKKQTVKVYPQSAFDPAKLGLHPVPIQLDDGVPRAAGSIEGVAGSFLVDTGAFGILAYKNYVDKLPFAPISSSQFSIGTVGGSMNAQVRDVTNLAFGDIMFRTANVVVPSASTFDITDYDAIIGRNALLDYLLYFDYADRMLYVKPNV